MPCRPSLRAACVASALALSAGLAPARADRPGAPPVTLEQIMADPDWIGNAPESPYWGDDGRAVYYRQKEQGSELRDLVRLDLATGTARVVPAPEKGAVDAPGGDWSRDRRLKVYAREGDLYLKDRTTGAVRQLTRTAEEESEPQWMAGDRRISFRRGTGPASFLVYDLATGLVSQPVDVRLEKDPADEDEPGFLKSQQIRLFDVVRKERRERDLARERERAEQRADPTRPPLPFYLGDKVRIDSAALSPSGDWLLLATTPAPEKGEEAPKSPLPKYVTESGNIEIADARPKVGVKPVPRSLTLLDLKNHRRYDLDPADLPGIFDDPLKELKAAAEARKEAAKRAREAKEAAERGRPPEPDKKDAEKGKGEPRPFEVLGMAWSRDGGQVAVQLHALDNKDRWIATVDLAAHRLVTRERLSDVAWVNWDHNDFGWLPDGRTLWYLSEASGYAHLYALDVASGRARQLTRGAFEASSPVATRDGRYLYYLSNAGDPGIYEVWRVETASGRGEPIAEPVAKPVTEQITKLGGLVSGYALSADERRLLLTHSTLSRPNELYVCDARPGAPAAQVTHTVSAAFLAVDWTVPQIVPVPSTHVSRPIYSRLYTPPAPDASRLHPAVVFVHGAGYLQNAHHGWSYYWREHLFHTLLARRGYVVLDMDYRASAGYGRDWRTAIYRQMGHPELEDLADGVAWLAAHEGVDPRRVGVYGGSYGGFMTFMALFRAPDLFAAGAALRPVSDWAHYEEGYTSAILNTPEVDPEAYAASSPIEFAAGLKKPLLICDGMQDDNVFFQDTVRVVQRLIELKKEGFETAIYPVESHAFRQPTSWLDEYRRILKLFETHLR